MHMKVHKRVIAHRINSFWIERVSMREEGRSPRLLATCDKKVQWVKVNNAWLMELEQVEVLSYRFRASSKELAKSGA